MRWLSFAILAYLAVAVQVGLGGLLDIGSATPNIALAAAVFVALHARRERALVGAMLLGLGQDLFTQQPMGLYAFSYGLTALFVVGLQTPAYQNSLIGRLIVMSAAAGVSGAVVAFNEWAYPILHGQAGSGLSLISTAASALYTAVLGTAILSGLARVKGVFAFRGRLASAARV